MCMKGYLGVIPQVILFLLKYGLMTIELILWDPIEPKNQERGERELLEFGNEVVLFRNLSN